MKIRIFDSELSTVRQEASYLAALFKCFNEMCYSIHIYCERVWRPYRQSHTPMFIFVFIHIHRQKASLTGTRVQQTEWLT
jgi:hypothetical protein